jgi:hypothetical protein
VHAITLHPMDSRLVTIPVKPSGKLPVGLPALLAEEVFERMRFADSRDFTIWGAELGNLCSPKGKLCLLGMLTLAGWRAKSNSHLLAVPAGDSVQIFILYR